MRQNLSGFGDAQLERHATRGATSRYEGYVARALPFEPHEERTMSAPALESILIVEDDDKLCARLAETATRNWNLRPLVASDYATGLALARAHRPSYGLIDLWIPGGTGIELIAAIRTEDKAARLILITGSGTNDDTVEAMLAGANYVLCKPFTSTELASRIFPHRAQQNEAEETTPAPFSVERLMWEHVHRVYREAGNNILRTARLIGLDRTTVKKWLRMTRPRR